MSGECVRTDLDPGPTRSGGAASFLSGFFTLAGIAVVGLAGALHALIVLRGWQFLAFNAFTISQGLIDLLVAVRRHASNQTHEN